MKIGNALNSSYLSLNTTSSQTSSTKQEDTSSQKTISTSGSELSASEQQTISQLRATDTKVRAHEMAHIAAGGGVIRGSANYTYEKGPDQQLYAVAGEVGIDTSEGSTPQETVTKMQTIRAAALAPSDPSPQDYAVASTASMLEMVARLQITRDTQDTLLAHAKKTYAAANNQDKTASFSNYA